MSDADLYTAWPEKGLEAVSACPVCGGRDRKLLHEGVADWSFETSPGLWTYVTCQFCESVYLDPRPTQQTIALAYGSYYTHQGPGAMRGLKSLKLRWKNERLTARFGKSIEPRLALPAILQDWVHRRAQGMALPFGWAELSSMAPGSLMDVGCGSGNGVALAGQLGWRATGLEMDAAAVAAARGAGLDVQHGGYELLFDMPARFDTIICSHVIEHVFDPKHMIRAMYVALKPGGTLLLSTPNASSDVHHHFGKYWRGLEAPRHLVLFTEATLSRLLTVQGFDVESRSDWQIETAKESARIASGGSKVRSQDRAQAKQMAHSLKRTPVGHDFIKLIVRRS